MNKHLWNRAKQCDDAHYLLNCISWFFGEEELRNWADRLLEKAKELYEEALK